MGTPATSALTENGDIDIALEVTDASKTFGSIRVLDKVNLQIARGEIRALVGENGSGKSTLVKILAGYHAADPGSAIIVAGNRIETRHPGTSEDAGLRFVHQDLALVGELTSVENLGLGSGYGSRRARPVRWAQRRKETQSAIAQLGYTFDVDRPVGSLQASERTALAVARAVSSHHTVPRLLVLDEPTANLPGPEVERLFTLIRRVRDSGIAILFVSHHLGEVFDLADSVTVLRSGTLVATKAVADIDESELIEMMVGRVVERTTGTTARPHAEVVLSVSGISGRTVENVDLTVASGEIVGIAGITGSGREALAPLLFGVEPRGGTVSVAGVDLRGHRPDLSIAAGMALVPAERKNNAILLGHDVAENFSIARPQDFVRHRVLRRQLEVAATSQWLRILDVRPRRPRMSLSDLSGGNAQKVILARWLRLTPKVLILDEPTQGVDVGAKEDIYRRIEATATQGCAVIVCSTDSEELARMCSRVVVLARGHVAVELCAPIHPDDITAASLTGARGTH